LQLNYNLINGIIFKKLVGPVPQRKREKRRIFIVGSG
jgi:hypothetical protein